MIFKAYNWHFNKAAKMSHHTLSEAKMKTC